MQRDASCCSWRAHRPCASTRVSSSCSRARSSSPRSSWRASTRSKRARSASSRRGCLRAGSERRWGARSAARHDSKRRSRSDARMSDLRAVTLERTLLLVKPDGVQRRLIGEVITRFERRGLHLVALKLLRIDRELAERHYAEHRGKPFFAGLVDFITSAPVVAMVWEGDDAVARVRSMMGATNPSAAAPGSIPGELTASICNNVVHGSDSPGRGAEEVALFFQSAELVEWSGADASWVNG